MVNDDKLKQAVRSYAAQISEALEASGASDVGVIIILARPTGDGEFRAHDCAAMNGRNMDGPTKRKIFKALHNEAGVIHVAPPDGKQ